MNLQLDEFSEAVLDGDVRARRYIEALERLDPTVAYEELLSLLHAAWADRWYDAFGRAPLWLEHEMFCGSSVGVQQLYARERLNERKRARA